MKKLVLAIIALLALFSALRAYTQGAAGGGFGVGAAGGGAGSGAVGLSLHPGLVEITDGTTTIGMAFGVAEKSGGEPATWSLLPLRLLYRSGDATVSIGLNGLSFLMQGGVTVGRAVRVDSPRTGDLVSVGGKVTVNSRVDGDVWTLGADVDLSPRADVTGSIVALGGKVTAAPGAVVGGTISAIPQVKIPFIGVLGTQFSIQILATGSQILWFVLLGFAIFLSCYYREAHARMLYQSIPASWREAVITLAVSLVVLPVVTVLLVVSVLGIFLIPVLAVVVIYLGLDGFLALCMRLGGVLRRLDLDQSRNVPLHLVTSGLLGLFLVKLPALVGIFLTMLRSGTTSLVGQTLQVITLAASAAGMLYGFGASVAFVRRTSAKA
ncbi:MAG TPA: hypothetical protein VFI08_06660, partial [Spirochaetia bacterium]|nr:hypothetical protein [Spirochaetia bacterium]